jgi:hypothetical protein
MTHGLFYRAILLQKWPKEVYRRIPQLYIFYNFPKIPKKIVTNLTFLGLYNMSGVCTRIAEMRAINEYL